MLNLVYWPLMFLLVAIVCAVFGFSGMLMGASTLAQFLFIVFLALAALTSAFNAGRHFS